MIDNKVCDVKACMFYEKIAPGAKRPFTTLISKWPPLDH